MLYFDVILPVTWLRFCLLLVLTQFIKMNSYVHFNLATPLLFLIPLALRLIIDHYKISIKNQKITKSGYLSRNLLSGAGILLAAWVNHRFINPDPYYLTGVAYCFGMFLAVFDYGINISRGEIWYYTSSDVNHPSYWERVRQKMTPLTELVVKIFLLACGIAVYYQYTFL